MIDWIPSEGGTHSEWVPPLCEGHNTEFLGSAFLPWQIGFHLRGGTHSEWVPPLRGAQHRISGFCFFAMTDWIPSEGRNPFRMGSSPQMESNLPFYPGKKAETRIFWKMRAYLPLTMDQFYFFVIFCFCIFLEFGLFLHLCVFLA